MIFDYKPQTFYFIWRTFEDLNTGGPNGPVCAAGKSIQLQCAEWIQGAERVETGSGAEAGVTVQVRNDGLATALPEQVERKEQS